MTIFVSLFPARDKDIQALEEKNVERAAQGLAALPKPMFTSSMKDQGAEKPHSFVKAIELKAMEVNINSVESGGVDANVVLVPNAAKAFAVNKAKESGNQEEIERVSAWPDFNGFAFVKNAPNASDKGRQFATASWKLDANGKRQRIEVRIGERVATTASV